MKRMAATNIAIPLPFLHDACLRVQAVVPEPIDLMYRTRIMQVSKLSVNSTNISKKVSTTVSGDVWSGDMFLSTQRTCG